MKTYVASSPDVEVNGQTIYAIVQGMGAFKSTAIKILSENGINDPKPGKFYSQQAWLNSFRKIAEKVGDATLFNIGLKIPENAIFPNELNNVHEALAAIDIAYYNNHRGGEIGHYEYTRTEEYSGTFICTNPYPDEFDKGIITAMCRKFMSDITLICVIIDERKPVRSKGGDSTTFMVNWK